MATVLRWYGAGEGERRRRDLVGSVHELRLGFHFERADAQQLGRAERAEEFILLRRFNPICSCAVIEEAEGVRVLVHLREEQKRVLIVMAGEEE